MDLSITGGGGGGMAMGGQAFVGVGQRLGDGHPDRDAAHHNRPAKELAGNIHNYLY